MSPRKPAQPTVYRQLFDRRMFLTATTATGAGLSLGITPAHADIRPKTLPVISGPAISGLAILRAIPRTAERIPVIGLGMWITFNVGSSRRRRDGRAEVLRTFFDQGGMVVDSSPMYGSAEDVIGYCLDKIGTRESLFGTTKVWTPLIADWEDQMSESRALWGAEKFDLMQVHNLVNWEGHLETLSDYKAAPYRHHNVAWQPPQSGGAVDGRPRAWMRFNLPTTSPTGRRNNACCRWRRNRALLS